MGEHIRVDIEGLLSHAGMCNRAAMALPVPAPPAAGHLTQATAVAVARGHTLTHTVATQLSYRATDTGAILRTAAAAYVSTDGGSAQSISTTVQF